MIIAFLAIMCVGLLVAIVIGLWACLVAAKRADEIIEEQNRKGEKDSWQKLS